MAGTKNYLYASLGLLCVGLGALGVLLPGLPTTPFILLAAYLFSRSNPRLYRWLITNEYFGKHVEEYLKNPSIPLKVKVLAISMMLLMVGYSALVLIDIIALKLLVLGLGIVGVWYVGFHIPTKK